MLQKFVAQILRFDRWFIYLGIPLLSVLMHGRIFSLELTGPHVWRQTQTQQTIDSFVEEDFCILNPRRLERGNGDGIFRMEFPLFQWLVAAVGKCLGQSVLLTRIMTMLIGFAAIWGIHFMLLGLHHDRLVALIGSYLFALSPVIHYYGISPLPDILALSLAIWGSAFALRWAGLLAWQPIAAASILLGLATLVKLPYVMFYALPLGGMLHALIRKLGWGKVVLAGAFLSVSLLPAVAWYAWVMPTWSNVGAVTGLFTPGVDLQEVGAILRFHALEMVPRTLMSVAALPLAAVGIYVGLRGKWSAQTQAKVWMLGGFAISFGLYYAYELVMISYYHDYYMQPLTVLLILPQALGGAWLLQRSVRWQSLGALALIALVPLMTYRRIHPRWQAQNAEFDRDLVTYQNALRSAVPEDALVVAGPDISHNIFLYAIHKKGWSWDRNQAFDLAKLQAWQAQGAQYFYCDDRGYDSLPEIQAMIGAPIGVYGKVRVYRLGN